MGACRSNKIFRACCSAGRLDRRGRHRARFGARIKSHSPIIMIVGDIRYHPWPGSIYLSQAMQGLVYRLRIEVAHACPCFRRLRRPIRDHHHHRPTFAFHRNTSYGHIKSIWGGRLLAASYNFFVPIILSATRAYEVDLNFQNLELIHCYSTTIHNSC